MPTKLGSSTIGHVPVGATPQHTVPGVLGTPPKTLATPSKSASLTVNGKSISIDLSTHGVDNIISFINSAGLGVVASVDRNGALQLSGANIVLGGDATLLAALGLVAG
jgi:hypothetical protein